MRDNPRRHPVWLAMAVGCQLLAACARSGLHTASEGSPAPSEPGSGGPARDDGPFRRGPAPSDAGARVPDTPADSPDAGRPDAAPPPPGQPPNAAVADRAAPDLVFVGTRVASDGTYAGGRELFTVNAAAPASVRRISPVATATGTLPIAHAYSPDDRHVLLHQRVAPSYTQYVIAHPCRDVACAGDPPRHEAVLLLAGSPIHDVGFAPDSRGLFLVGRETLHYVALQDGVARPAVLLHEGMTSAHAFALGGRLLLAVEGQTDGGRLLSYDLESLDQDGRPHEVDLTPDDVTARTLPAAYRLSPDGVHLGFTWRGRRDGVAVQGALVLDLAAWAAGSPHRRDLDAVARIDHLSRTRLVVMRTTPEGLFDGYVAERWDGSNPVPIVDASGDPLAASEAFGCEDRLVLRPGPVSVELPAAEDAIEAKVVHRFDNGDNELFRRGHFSQACDRLVYGDTYLLDLDTGSSLEGAFGNDSPDLRHTLGPFGNLVLARTDGDPLALEIIYTPQLGPSANGARFSSDGTFLIGRGTLGAEPPGLWQLDLATLSSRQLTRDPATVAALAIAHDDRFVAYGAEPVPDMPRDRIGSLSGAYETDLATLETRRILPPSDRVTGGADNIARVPERRAVLFDGDFVHADRKAIYVAWLDGDPTPSRLAPAPDSLVPLELELVTEVTGVKRLDAEGDSFAYTEPGSEGPVLTAAALGDVAETGKLQARADVVSDDRGGLPRVRYFGTTPKFGVLHQIVYEGLHTHAGVPTFTSYGPPMALDLASGTTAVVGGPWGATDRIVRPLVCARSDRFFYVRIPGSTLHMVEGADPQREVKLADASSFAVAPDGSWVLFLAPAAPQGSFVLWAIDLATMERTEISDQVDGNSLDQLVFSADSSSALYLTGDRTLERVARGAPASPQRLTTSAVFGFAASADASTIVATLAGRAVRLVRVAEPLVEHPIFGDVTDTARPQLSADGRRAVLRPTEGPLLVADLHAGTVRGLPGSDEHQLPDGALDAGGRYLYSSWYDAAQVRQLYLWDLEGGHEPTKVGTPDLTIMPRFWVEGAPR